MQTQSKYSHVIWDWNGTLFDDVAWCISKMNEMLGKRRMKLLGSILEYRCPFCFPIINYYKNVGFDFEKESFEILAKEYNSLYHSEQTIGHQDKSKLLACNVPVLDNLLQIDEYIY